MARLGRGRRIKPIYLRAPSVTTPTPLVRKRVIVELQTTNRLKYFRTHNVKHFRLIKPPVQPVVVVPWVRPKIVVEKTTINRFKLSRHRRPVILRAPQLFIAPPVTVKVTQPIVVQQRRQALIRLHRHKQAIVLRSVVAPFRSTRPIFVSKRRTKTIRRRRPIVLRGVSTPTFQPRLFKPYVVNRNQRRLAQFRQRNKSPFIFYFPGGAAAIPPPPDTGHHTTLFLTRFGFYV